MARHHPFVPALAFVAALLPSPASSEPPAPSLTAALSAEEVECERARLTRFFWVAEGSADGGGVDVGGFHVPVSVFVSSSGGDALAILLVANQWPWLREGEPFPPHRQSEAQLAASLRSATRRTFLNPERPMLRQFELMRDDANSSISQGLGGPGQPPRARISLAVTMTFGTAGHLVIDLAQRSSASGPGRYFESFGPATTCHDRLTDEDRFVLSVLQRIVRPRFEHHFPFDGATAGARVIALRDQDPDSFLIDVRQGDWMPPFGPGLRFRLRVERDDRGRLTLGWLELLSSGPHQWPRELFIIPATFPGRDVWDEGDPRVTRLTGEHDFAAGPVAIDLAELLADTSWNPARY